MHGWLGAFRQNRCGTGDFHFRQLGRGIPQGGRACANAGGDEPANHRRIGGHIVECGGRAEIRHQNRPAILVVGSRTVGNAVRAHILRIVHANIDAGFDSRSNNHRIDIEEFHNAGTERMHDLRHHRRDDHIVHIARRIADGEEGIAGIMMELRDHQAIFIRRVVRLRGDAIRAGDMPVIEKADHHIGVADVDCDQKHVEFSLRLLY